MSEEKPYVDAAMWKTAIMEGNEQRLEKQNKESRDLVEKIETLIIAAGKRGEPVVSVDITGVSQPTISYALDWFRNKTEPIATKIKVEKEIRHNKEQNPYTKDVTKFYVALNEAFLSQQ